MAQVQAAGTRTAKDAALGAMPEWRLEHLYPAMDSAEFAADLARAAAEAAAFGQEYRGTLEALLRGPEGAAALHGAIRRYEALEDLMGRIMSYAGLIYAGDTTDPARGKFYGDAQEKMTNASSDLLFFMLELNRIDDSLLDSAMREAPLAHYAPWLEDIRKEKPYQLDDKLEQLFLDKSVVGRGAWNRLFDETIASLRFDVDGEPLTLEPTLNLLQDADEAKRRKGAEALARTFGENIRLFTLVTNVLAKDKEISDRWRGFTDVADSRHLGQSRRARGRRGAWSRRFARPIRALPHRYYKHEGPLARDGEA